MTSGEPSSVRWSKVGESDMGNNIQVRYLTVKVFLNQGALLVLLQLQIFCRQILDRTNIFLF